MTAELISDVTLAKTILLTVKIHDSRIGNISNPLRPCIIEAFAQQGIQFDRDTFVSLIYILLKSQIDVIEWAEDIIRYDEKNKKFAEAYGGGKRILKGFGTIPTNLES